MDRGGAQYPEDLNLIESLALLSLDAIAIILESWVEWKGKNDHSAWVEMIPVGIQRKLVFCLSCAGMILYTDHSHTNMW